RSTSAGKPSCRRSSSPRLTRISRGPAPRVAASATARRRRRSSDRRCDRTRRHFRPLTRPVNRARAADAARLFVAQRDGWAEDLAPDHHLAEPPSVRRARRRGGLRATDPRIECAMVARLPAPVAQLGLPDAARRHDLDLVVEVDDLATDDGCRHLERHRLPFDLERLALLDLFRTRQRLARRATDPRPLDRLLHRPCPVALAAHPGAQALQRPGLAGAPLPPPPLRRRP